MKEGRVLFNDILNTFYLQNICMNAWSDGIRVRWTDGWTGVLMEMDEWIYKQWTDIKIISISN